MAAVECPHHCFSEVPSAGSILELVRLVTSVPAWTAAFDIVTLLREGKKVSWENAFETLDDKTLASILQEIQDSITDKTCPWKLEEWKVKSGSVSRKVEAEFELRKKRRVKKPVLRHYAEEVDLLGKAFGPKESLLLAQLQDYEKWYATDQQHVRLMLNILGFISAQHTLGDPGNYSGQGASKRALEEVGEIPAEKRLRARSETPIDYSEGVQGETTEPCVTNQNSTYFSASEINTARPKDADVAMLLVDGTAQQQSCWGNRQQPDQQARNAVVEKPDARAPQSIEPTVGEALRVLTPIQRDQNLERTHPSGLYLPQKQCRQDQFSGVAQTPNWYSTSPLLNGAAGSRLCQQPIPTSKQDMTSLRIGSNKHPLLYKDNAFIYAGIGFAKKKEDCVLNYQWSGVTALGYKRDKFTEPFADGLWIYEHPDRSLVLNLPNKELSESIQRCKLWIEELQQGLRTTSCFVFRTPKPDIIRHFGCHLFVACTVPRDDAPRMEKFIVPSLEDYTSPG
jgi:hypothetical protein